MGDTTVPGMVSSVSDLCPRGCSLLLEVAQKYGIGVTFSWAVLICEHFDRLILIIMQ